MNKRTGTFKNFEVEILIGLKVEILVRTSITAINQNARGVNPIQFIKGGGGGVFSTSKPVNCSELQNETSYNLETW